MNTLSSAKVAKIIDLVLDGNSVRYITKDLHISKNTVLHYRKDILEKFGPVNCKCGREAGHRGWCEPRVQKSEKRQDFLLHWKDMVLAPKPELEEQKEFAVVEYTSMPVPEFMKPMKPLPTKAGRPYRLTKAGL